MDNKQFWARSEVFHVLRIEFGFSPVELLVLDFIHKTQGYKSPISGYCSYSDQSIADQLGCSRRLVFGAIKKAVENGLVERKEDFEQFKRCTDKYIEYTQWGNKDFAQPVQNLHNPCAEKLQDPVQILHNIDINSNKEEFLYINIGVEKVKTENFLEYVEKNMRTKLEGLPGFYPLSNLADTINQIIAERTESTFTDQEHLRRLIAKIWATNHHRNENKANRRNGKQNQDNAPEGTKSILNPKGIYYKDGYKYDATGKQIPLTAHDMKLKIAFKWIAEKQVELGVSQEVAFQMYQYERELNKLPPLDFTIQ